MDEFCPDLDPDQPHWQHNSNDEKQQTTMKNYEKLWTVKNNEKLWKN